jgi:hypothetical protein
MTTRVICIVVYIRTIRRPEFSASHMRRLMFGLGANICARGAVSNSCSMARRTQKRSFLPCFTCRSIGRVEMIRPKNPDDLLGHFAANRLHHLYIVLIPCKVNQDLTISQRASISQISRGDDGRNQQILHSSESW